MFYKMFNKEHVEFIQVPPSTAVQLFCKQQIPGKYQKYGFYFE